MSVICGRFLLVFRVVSTRARSVQQGKRFVVAFACPCIFFAQRMVFDKLSKNCVLAKMVPAVFELLFGL